MDLILKLGITASRANRGKSVKSSIAQRIGQESDEGNRGMASSIPENIVGQGTLKAAHHASNLFRTAVKSNSSLRKRY